MKGTYRVLCISLLGVFFAASIPAVACIRAKREVHIKKYANPGDDITVVLQKLIDKYSTIIIDPGMWYISPGVKLRSDVTIKGVDKETSILKRNDANGRIKGGVLFYTEKADVYVFTKQNPKDNFDEAKVKYSNILFKDLTIDFNRNPLTHSSEQIAKTNLFGIIFSRGKDCVVDNCRFLDSMNHSANNGCPAVSFLQSRNCSIVDCVSKHVTLVKSVYSRDVTVARNLCEDSIGTSIEFVCGDGGVLDSNYVNGVYWDVSCVGVNTTNCLIRNNTIYSSSDNVSCLTLGHRGYEGFSASGTVVSGNNLHSEGVRSILIQNGSDIYIENNSLSCSLTEDSSTPTFGCIVARGEDIGNITILDNEMSASGDKIYGAITYAGRGNVTMRNNHIKSCRGIVLFPNGYDVIVDNNKIESSEYAICASSPAGLYVTGNHMTDGLSVKGGNSIVIEHNSFSEIVHPTYIYENWDDVSISDNTFSNCDKIQELFLLNVEHKEASFDMSRINVSRNEVMKGPNYLIRFSGNKGKKSLRNVMVTGERHVIEADKNNLGIE